MATCMIPGCPSEGIRVHGVEVAGTDCLLCENHYRLYYTAIDGGPGENDLAVYNRAYHEVFARRKREAQEKAQERQASYEAPAVDEHVEDGAPPAGARDAPVQVPPPSAPLPAPEFADILGAMGRDTVAGEETKEVPAPDPLDQPLRGKQERHDHEVEEGV